jgi:hypothetical protein
MRCALALTTEDKSFNLYRQSAEEAASAEGRQMFMKLAAARKRSISQDLNDPLPNRSTATRVGNDRPLKA